MPTIRGRNQLDAASGTSPRRAKTKPNFAVSAAILMSAGSVMVAPTPTAGPLTATITGLREAAMRSETIPPPSRRTPAIVPPACGSSPRPANVARPPARSAPAQKPRPAPVSRTTRTPLSASARSKAATSSPAIVAVKALSRSGRCSVIVAVPPATS